MNQFMVCVVCQKHPVAELVLYFDVWVQKIAKTAKKYHFWAYFDPFLSENCKTPPFPTLFRVWKWWISLFIFRNLKGLNEKVLSWILQLTERLILSKWWMFENCILSQNQISINAEMKNSYFWHVSIFPIFKHSPFAHYWSLSEL